MGDRANIVIESNGGRVYLYTHWYGHEMPAIAQDALRRKQRWGDAPYLARIVFCRMVRGQEGDETGFGISLRTCDNEHPICVINVDSQTVAFEADPNKDWIKHPVIGKKFSFSEYCALSDVSWESLELLEAA